MCGCPSIEEGLVQGIARNNTSSIVELHIPEPKLGGTSMGRYFGIFTGPKTDKKTNLDYAGRTFDLRRRVSPFPYVNNQPYGGGFPFLVAGQHRSSVLLFLITACQGLWMRSRVVSRGQRGLPVGRSWQQHATPLKPSLSGY